ncbi:MAG TPA: cupin domain-containing protein [Nitrospira sp.]|nr:cupin domain-containing protein [Nitrospira sp.]
MRITKLALCLIFAGTPALSIAAGHDVNAQTSGPQVTTIISKTDVAGIKDKEWKVRTIELAPGAVDARLFYSGVELVYVLEGAGRLEVDGKPFVALHPGAVAALNPKEIHVLKNTNQTQTLKVVVVLLREKGQPPLAFGNRGTPSKAVEQDNSTVPRLVF